MTKINVIHHAQKLKEVSHAIISIALDKLTKFNIPFKKSFNKVGIWSEFPSNGNVYIKTKHNIKTKHIK